MDEMVAPPQRVRVSLRIRRSQYLFGVSAAILTGMSYFSAIRRTAHRLARTNDNFRGAASLAKREAWIIGLPMAGSEYVDDLALR